MTECKHGIDKSWCVLCKGTTTIVTRDPTRTECCSPGCSKPATVQVGSLPLCPGHKAHLDSHIVKTKLPINWEKMQRDWERETERQHGTEWVYFVRLGDRLKIGYSTKVFARLRTFAAYGQETVPLGFEGGGRDLEGRLHRRFREHRAKEVLSKELFLLHQDILDYIESERTCALCKRRAQPERVICSRHRFTDFDALEALVGVQLHMPNGKPLEVVEGS